MWRHNPNRGGGKERRGFLNGTVLFLFIVSLAALAESPPAPPAKGGNPFGGAPTDNADFEDDDFIDPGGNNFGFPNAKGPSNTPPDPDPIATPEPTRVAPAPTNPAPVRPPPRSGTPPARMSGRTTAPVPAPTPSTSKTAAAAKAAKLADYLELDPSVKGLEVKNFDLPDKDIKDVVTLISKWTGKNFILDSKVRGKITIIGPSQVTLQEAYQAFLSALEANGLTTVQSGKFIRVIESAEARRAPVKTYSGDYAPKDDQFITRVFQLKYINADEVQREFRDLTTRQGKLFAYEPTNSIIITDTGSNIQRIKELLETLDVKSFETTLHVLKVRNSSAKVIADMLGEIYGDDKKAGGGSQARSFRRSALERTRGGGIITKIIPDEQTNSLVVLANQSGYESLRKLVERLDVKVTDTGRIHVYYCEHAKAEDLAQTLASLAGGGPGGGGKTTNRNTRVTTGPQGGPGGQGGPAGPTGPVTAELEGGIKITSDAATNSLVITANSADYQTIKRVIRKLDIPRLQVFVETAILEIALNDNHKWGTNLGLISGDGRFRGGFTTDAATDIQNILAGLPIGGATVPIFGPGFKSDTPGGGVQAVTLTGLLNFLTTNSNTSILSTPQIIALDNEKAEFKVQDEIPVLEGFTPLPQGTNNPVTVPTGTIGKKKTGIDIKLTPHVNAASRMIRLEIDQTVDSLSNQSIPGDLGKVSVATTTRQTNTQVVVKDGDFVALGGLMSDKADEVIRKVPVLGDIPILGWLFKGRDYKVTKTNLVILLHPRIIGTSLAAANIIKEQMENRDAFIEEHSSGDRHEERVSRMKEKLKEQEERGRNDRAYDYKNVDDDEEDSKRRLGRPGEASELNGEEKPRQEKRPNVLGSTPKADDGLLLPDDNGENAKNPGQPTPPPAPPENEQGEDNS